MGDKLRPVTRQRQLHRWLSLLIMLSLVAGLWLSAFGRTRVVNAATPGWMDADTAAQLTAGFDVLVPGWIPAPFSAQPDVSASNGFYEIYWVITGGDPTFLDITGTVGGSIPDFSWYDRNNELQQNADVGGVPAYRDLTPIYDNVYWQVGDVVYTVSSQGLTETDSLSLANTLVPLDEAEEAAPLPAVLIAPDTASPGEILAVTVSNGNGATLTASDGVFSDTGNNVYPDLRDASLSWTAPTVPNEHDVTFSLVDPVSGSWLAGATTRVVPSASPSLGLECGPQAASGDEMAIRASGAGNVVIDVSAGSWRGQDNPGFDVTLDGSRLSGEIDGGSTTLLWQAPVTDEPLDATITISGMSGAVATSCDVAVSPAVIISPTPPEATVVPTAAGSAEAPSVPATAASSAAPSRASEPLTPSRDANSARRNRPARTSTMSPLPTDTPMPRRDRSPANDGTGGPLHPRYAGAPRDVSGSDPMIAPTSAPLPAPPRELRDTPSTAGIDAPDQSAASKLGAVSGTQIFGAAILLLMGGIAAGLFQRQRGTARHRSRP